MGQKWPETAKKPKMARNGQKTKNGHFWPKMAILGQKKAKRSKMAKNGQKTKNGWKWPF